ncbi:hypothetical protein TEA_021950 [Camellia sinensis var. sinensis]|uniref:AP-2 complex subunit alpha n=1 Tax=Camellia sinensis var. sinensis TaxID=542762 RepID=A0A4S4DL92_CAMSN|nr:hypothetical protein TEA_021950 [Camellia sinensis var. sinensis]
MALSGMRGLSVFISDIRNCQNKEQERLRVDKELGNIRNRFKNEKGLSPYEKKKYVWKMLYIFMLGYDVDFGHMEAVSLISAPKYPEKQVGVRSWVQIFAFAFVFYLHSASLYVGYIVTSCLLNENHDFLRLAINTVRNDIIGRNETFQCLALTLVTGPTNLLDMSKVRLQIAQVGNIGGKDFSESLAPDVQKLLISSSCRPLVRKKAALCLLRLYRKNPDVVNVDGWSDRMAQLLDERDLGVLTSSISLLVALVANNHDAYWSSLPKCVKILERLARNQDVPQEYTYYGIPSPWLQVKTMRALQYFPTIEDPNTRRSLFEVLQRILMGTDVVKNVNKNNASHAVLFEALALRPLGPPQEHKPEGQATTPPNHMRSSKWEGPTRVESELGMWEANPLPTRLPLRGKYDQDAVGYRCSGHYQKASIPDHHLIEGSRHQYLSTADFAMREELSLKAAILAEKFAPDLSWYVDVILQLIDKAGDFVSDDIWFRVVQFVTNNEDLQPYAAVKAREYIDKPATHETMVKVSAYILGEYSHLLARRPGCSPKEIFNIIHEKLPTVSTSTIPILLSTYAKILMHTQPPDPELQNQIWAIFHKYESCIEVEIQQRAVEYFELSRKGEALMDIMAEMPKFPERQSALIKKAEDTEADTAEQSALRLRAQQQTSNALVVTDQRPANGTPPVSQIGLVKVPSMSNVDHNLSYQGVTQENGTLSMVDPQPPEPSPDLLGDLLGPLAIEGPPGAASQSEHNLVPGAEGAPNAEDALAIAPVEEQINTVQPIGNIAERFHALCLKDSGVLYEDPYIQIGIKAEWQAHHGRLVLFLGNKNTAPLVSVQALILPPSHLKIELSLVPEVIPPRAQVQCPLEFINLRPSRDVAVLDFSYKFGTHVNVKLRLPAVFNKFLQPVTVSAEEFFPQWRSLAGPPLKLQEVVRGVRPMSLAEMANLFYNFRLMICPGLDPNANNLVASTTFFSESTRAMLCLIRIETDPADRTQLRMTVASGDPTLTYELKEFIKEQLVTIPTVSWSPAPAPPQAQPTSAPTALSDPGALLAGLLH